MRCEVKDKEVEYIRDALGWIDDFRAPAGICGQPFTRRILIHAAINHRLSYSLRDLSNSQYDKEEVRSIMNSILDDVYDESR